MYVVYGALLAVYALAMVPGLVYARWRHRKSWGRVAERLGRLPERVNPHGEPSIWIHAVSVGEALAARPLVRALRAAYPRHRLVMSTTTVTGQQVARHLGTDLDAVFYVPFDFVSMVRRTLDRIRPVLLIVVDTELWPNLLRGCRRRGVRTMVVNGRVSDRSFRRYRAVRWFMRRVLRDVDHVCAQTEGWARRFVALGADARRVSVTGSLKFDAVDAGASEPGSDPLRACFAFAAERPVLIAASTLRGEEEPVLRAFGRIRVAAPDAVLILAPRHPERFAEARARAAAAGFAVRLRSTLPAAGPVTAPVIVLDTIGELARLFPLASAVFVGGSLVPAGGHNLLEPAGAGKAIVVGPHMENFADVTAQFVAAGALVQVRSEAELEETLVAVMDDAARRAALGAAARALVDAHRGATRRSLDVVATLLDDR